MPHIGWNGVRACRPNPLLPADMVQHFYYVHSYRAVPEPANAADVLATTDYGGDRYVAAVMRGNLVATQFHPEKSGAAGLAFLDRYAQTGNHGR